MLICSSHMDEDLCECKEKQWASLSPQERKMALKAVDDHIKCYENSEIAVFATWPDFVKMRELGFKLEIQSKQKGGDKS